MKKILLGTTGLVGAAMLASAASAETPKVTLGGFSDFQAGYVSDDQDSSKREGGLRNDNTLIVKVDGKTSGGLGYGAQIDLEADVTNDTNNQGTNASRTFTYLEGVFGRVELGSTRSVAATQRIDASTLAAATGGINGAFNQFVSNRTSLGGNFISNAKLTSEHGRLDQVGDERTYNATKINYYTPKYYGFQAGVSYTPQIEDRGQDLVRSDTNGIADIWDFAIGYENTFNGGIKFAASGTYEFGDGRGLAGSNSGLGTDDVNAWNLGALVGYKGFSLAGSYGDYIDSGIDDQDGWYWTIGAGYAAGPVGLSVTFIDSQFGTSGANNDFDNVVIGADYKLAPGLTPYAEVSFYDFNPAGASNGNQGTAVILGTQVAF